MKHFGAIAVVVVYLCAALFAQDKYAVVVGVNKYDALASLQAGVNDAEKIGAYYSGIGFRVWMLDDRQSARMDQPGLSNLERVMANVKETAAGHPVKELVFFFAGHGVQINGQNWLCFPETDIKSQTGMLNVDTKLLPWLRDLGADLTMVYLDACRNDLGGMRAAGVERGLTVQGLVDEPTASNKPSSNHNIAVFYAAKPGSFSYEKPDGTNGFFTETLVEALQADATHNIADLYKYLRTALPERTEKAFGRPQIPNLGGDLDIGVAFSKGKVDLSAMDTGAKLYVESDQSGATVSINGIKRGQTPLLVEGIDPGLVTVEVAKEGKYASSQVSLALRGYSKVSLVLEKSAGDVLVQSVRIKTGDNQTVPAGNVGQFVSGMDVKLDGQRVGSANSALLSDLEPGSHTIALIGKGWGWNGAITIKPREAVQIQPVFSPIGTLKTTLPTDCIVKLVRQSDGAQLDLLGDSTSLDDFPIGTWLATISGRQYTTQTLSFTLKQGEGAELAPQMSLKPSFDRGEQINGLKQELAMQQSLLPQQKQARAKWDSGGWTGVIVGLAAIVGGGVCATLSYTTFQDYLGSTDPTTAKASHDNALNLWNVAWILGAAGAGTSLLSGLIGFGGGEKPDVTEKSVITIESKIKALEAQGVEYLQ